MKKLNTLFLILTLSTGCSQEIVSSKYAESINSNDLEIIYADLNQGRLSSYHRLDIAIKKHVEINKTTTLDFTASVTNLYNRQNIFYVDRVTTDKVYQLPLLPSLGISCKF